MNFPQNQAVKPRQTLWFFVSIAILGTGVALFVLLRALKPAPEQRDPATLIPSVQTSPLQHRDSPLFIEGNGMVAPKSAITISAQVSGEIVDMHPNLVTGGAFEKGEILARIDPRSYQANLAEAEANQAANQANLEYLNKQVDRMRSLRDRDFTGEDALDDAINRREQTLAAIARQEAIFENRRLDLERTAIRAPFSGRIYSENVDLGDIVSPGMELARFYASDEVEIVVALNTDDSVFIPGLWTNSAGDFPGRLAWVTVDHGGREYKWQGYVHRVESDIDRTTRTVDVVVRVAAPFTPGTPVGDHDYPVQTEPPPLLVGMYTDVAIEGMQLPGHFTLPISAMRQNDTVWTVNGEGVLEIVPVEFVRQEGNVAVLLADNLPEGTPIIVSNIALVSDGMRVQLSQQSQGAIR